jgi:alpha/beta hydrolase fold
MRACQPVADGYVERDGVKVHDELFGAGEPTVLLLPTWSIVHSRLWKMQIPYLARHCRVLTFDPRGNGRSDRPTEPKAYAEQEFAADALAVMDATQTPRAVVVGFSMGAHRGLLLAANHPERVQAAAFIGGSYQGGGEPVPERTVYSWEDELDTDEGWAKHNQHYWLRDYPGYLEFFFSRFCPGLSSCCCEEVEPMSIGDFPGGRWQGQWIAAEVPDFAIDPTSLGGDLPSAGFSRVQFRRTFELGNRHGGTGPGAAASVGRLPVPAVGQRRRGRPGTDPSQPRRLRYDEYDIAKLLRAGRNVVAVLVAYYGSANSFWQPAASSGVMGRDAQLVLEARLGQAGQGEEDCASELQRKSPRPYCGCAARPQATSPGSRFRSTVGTSHSSVCDSSTR